MRLKRLEVRGFKSFADKTVFDFESDLTGIVGPNGCGKSNVVDALKWVLGDQRAKSLRGAEMTDVIFKGAEGREGLQAAEVTVVLENPVPHGADDGNGDGNSSRSALQHLTEVRIGRRLTLDKESSYLLNGEVVRLKDVRSMLMDTGLGVGAYSVMEQGRIDAVLSANPEERRAIFEEAAGISKFKVQKREALRKLERTEHNLARVKDLLEERSRRIRGLKIQAGKARRWREIQAGLRDLRSAIAVQDAGELRREEAARRERLANGEREAEAIDQRLVAARAELATIEDRIGAAQVALEESQEALRATTSRREAAIHRAGTLDERAEELRGDAESCIARSSGLDEQRTERRGQLVEARQRLEASEAELIGLGRDAEQRREAVRAAQALVTELQAARETARDAMLELIHERTRHRNASHDLVATLRGVRGARSRLDARLATIRADSDERQRRVFGLDRATADLTSRDAFLLGREEAVLGRLATADHHAADLTRRETALREQVASTASRLDTLQGMESGLEGLDAGPRYVLESQPAGLVGRLLDLVQVDLEYSKALEAALGSYVQALVVQTRRHGEAILQRLEQEGKGRALLLIADEFGERLERSSVFSLPDHAEFLFRKVRCRPDAWPMVQWLLRGVCFVETAAQARPERTDLCFVTRDGTVMCGPRVEGGGEAVAGLVVRRAQIRALEVELAAVQAELDALRVEMESAADVVRDLERCARRVNELRQQTRTRCQQAVAEIVRLRERLAEHAREAGELDEERRRVSGQEISTLSRLADEALAELMVRGRERRAAAEEQRFAAELDAARVAGEEVNRREQEVRVRQAELRSEREAQVHRIESLDQTIRDLTDALADLDQRREDALGAAETARHQADDCRHEIAGLGDAVVELEARRAERMATLAGERDARQQHRQSLEQQDAERETLQQSVGELRVQLVEFGHRFARLEERLRDDVGVELRRLLGEIEGRGLEPDVLDGPTAPAGMVERLSGPPLPMTMLAPERELRRLWTDPEFDLEASRREAQGLQAQRERLGAVNLDAVRELEDEEASFGTLEHDYADLSESRKSLMEGLRRMELESRTMFERTFEEARENFRGIFRKLFQGGRADMYLTESEDALDSGIEIVAKPPGKELQSIALLSGGERSLTALAILFAVFKVKPSPFCILDEVDAALDETNVERFLRVLQDFVGPSQFCIVTHHKRTMAECRVLYGITMQKRGVSTRISVALDEVDAFTEAPGFRNAVQQRIAGEERVGF